jgi:hypothetical protein
MKSQSIFLRPAGEWAGKGKGKGGKTTDFSGKDVRREEEDRLRLPGQD